ncbi:hypothetical protein ABWI01_03340 [Oceanicaulis alexandrii]|uniref:hypothetical protein n=1 Tax=Oceanicaulis alexandrii TaxID=153233 RepID=UPI0035CFDFA5
MGNFRKARLPSGVAAFKSQFDVMPSAYLDFRNRELFYPYFRPSGFVDIPGASFSRASSATGFVDGVMTEFAADQPRLTDDGLVRVTGVTNKVQAYAKPLGGEAGAAVSNSSAGGAGVLSLVNDAAALSAEGLGEITNSIVYRLDNSSGTDESRIRFNGIFDTTNNACWSAYVRSISGGNGQIKLRTAFGAYPFLSGLDANFKRFEQSTPNRNAGTGSPNDVLWVAAQAGEIIHVCLPMAEENRLTTSPYVPTSGAAASTDTDQAGFASVAGLSLDAATQANGYTLIGWIGAHERRDVAARIIGMDAPGTTSLINFIGNSSTNIGVYNGETVLGKNGAISAGSPFSFTLTQSSAFRGLSVAGSAMVSDTEGCPAFTSLHLGEAPTGGNAMRLITLERLIVLPRLVTAAEAQAMNQWSPS